MQSVRSDKTNYVIAALLGAAAGGLAMLAVTNALPKMMKRMLAGMMENMRSQMHAEGCRPEEM